MITCHETDKTATTTTKDWKEERIKRGEFLDLQKHSTHTETNPALYIWKRKAQMIIMHATQDSNLTWPLAVSRSKVTEVHFSVLGQMMNDVLLLLKPVSLVPFATPTVIQKKWLLSIITVLVFGWSNYLLKLALHWLLPPSSMSPKRKCRTENRFVRNDVNVLST